MANRTSVARWIGLSLIGTVANGQSAAGFAPGRPRGRGMRLKGQTSAQNDALRRPPEGLVAALRRV
jgi:hypothetical protein